VFLQLVGSAGHVAHSDASVTQNVKALFFMLGWDCRFGWDRYGFHKKHIGTHYAKLMFLHLVEPVSHVGHFGPSGVRNVDALFFVLRWHG
jgi:hypothetical protein